MEGQDTVWSAGARLSGRSVGWLPLRTEQTGGFGTAYVDTSVYLKRTRMFSFSPRVLAFECKGPVPRPYVLDNAANAGGTIEPYYAMGDSNASFRGL